MDISKLNDRDKEVSLLKTQLKRSQNASKAIWEYREYIEMIKHLIGLEDLTGASQLWNELDYPVQKLLNTAPRYGGAFTTQERSVIRSFWEIKEEDL